MSGFSISINAAELFSVKEEGDWDALEDEIPSRADTRPGGALAGLVSAAIQEGLIVGDRRLRLDVDAGDDADGPGYYVFLSNVAGEQRFLHVASSWRRLRFAEEGLDVAAVIRHYLTEVCGVANSLISDAQ
ncbi:hypothetical protein [Mycobacteroides abscessus]|uniref:hypothetical protein n=1 Tax=Mycobacteroides abscessus TaxID=36809 RepID=UPI0012FFF277|nr:hypothetical protein [Mycobacteroides abscessus]